MKQAEYINKAKEKLGLTSDYAFSLETNIHRGTLKDFRDEKRKFDEYTAINIAKILEIDPVEVIADVQSQLEKNEDKREFWYEQLEKKQAGYITTNTALKTTFAIATPISIFYVAKETNIIGKIAMFASEKIDPFSNKTSMVYDMCQCILC